MRAAARPIEEDELHAWVDGRLTAERAEAVEALFAANPEKGEQWSQYAEQREALRAAFAAQPAESIPRRLRLAQEDDQVVLLLGVFPDERAVARPPAGLDDPFLHLDLIDVEQFVRFELGDQVHVELRQQVDSGV